MLCWLQQNMIAYIVNVSWQTIEDLIYARQFLRGCAERFFLLVLGSFHYIAFDAGC